jgi:hypothetical protein
MTIDLQAVQVMEDGDKRRIKNGRTGPTLFWIGWYRTLPVSKRMKANVFCWVWWSNESCQGIFWMGLTLENGRYSSLLWIDKQIQYGKENILSVRLEKQRRILQMVSQAGIYRKVRLAKIPVRWALELILRLL